MPCRCTRLEVQRGFLMRVAIVHDWLYTIGGAERVLQEMLRCYPDADVFCLFDFLTAEDRSKIGLNATRTTFIQKLPFVRRAHRAFLPLFPIAIEQLDLSPYDLIISSSYAAAKGVLTGPDQLHVSYVHSPIRYAWDLQHTYLARNKSSITTFLPEPFRCDFTAIGLGSALIIQIGRHKSVRHGHGIFRRGGRIGNREHAGATNRADRIPVGNLVCELRGIVAQALAPG